MATKFVPLVCMALLLTFLGCEKNESPTSPTAPAQSGPQIDEPDSEGNLLVINQTGKVVVLYANGKRMKTIPASSGRFLVNVDNPDEMTVDLWIFDWAEISDSLDSPPLDRIFKRWSAPLTSNAADNEFRVTWQISAESAEMHSGTLFLRYRGSIGEAKNVSVFLNSRSGSLIGEMKPGDRRNIVGLDYGAYTLNYRYVFDDKEDREGEVLLGWIDTEKVSG
ncbi:MAG: hypothetical protein HN590_07685, partial [Calditrichaeota bacterium]|nr:hypothetical protein [Calditrichota bacterium]